MPMQQLVRACFSILLANYGNAPTGLWSQKNDNIWPDESKSGS